MATPGVCDMQWPSWVSWVFNEHGDFGGGGDTKEATRQEDIARQREETQNIGNQFLSQLAPNSQEFNELQAQLAFHTQNVASPENEQEIIRQLGQRLVSQQQARVAAGGAAGPLEERTNLAFQGLRDINQRVPFEEDIFRILSGEAPTTAFGKQIAAGSVPTTIEQELLNALQGLPTTTPIGGVFRKPLALAAEPTLRPGAPVDDAVFKNALKLVEDRVNAEAAGRGLLGGGLRLEQLGRAGTEASIAEAQRQDQLRDEQNRLQQEAFANSIGLFDTGRSIPIAYRDYLSQLFNVGEGLRQRDIGLEGALVDLQLGRETNLTGLLNQNQQTRLTDINQLFQRQTTRAEDISNFERVLSENDKRALQQAAADIGVAFAGGQEGSRAFRVPSFPSSGTTTSPTTTGVPKTGMDLLDLQRSNQTPSGTPSFPSLSRQPDEQIGQLSLEELIRLLQQSGGTP